MKIMKKIGALVCAAAISVSMVSAIPVGAYDYEACGLKSIKKSDMPNGWGKFAKYVYTDSYHGKKTAGELWIITSSGKEYAQAQSHVSDRSCSDKNGNDYYMTSHQARVRSGGKLAETEYYDASGRWPITTGKVKVKNNAASVESYYRYYKN